ncbi:MAG: PTS mannitol transporter subunit IICBA [Clostridiales bacterium]|nr:PTS mannitol transporter subunit IICBA [Clostridiales bacterium]
MKERVQSIGRFLSGMIMPNMGVFIAWGIITALFIPDGWIPNEKFATLVSPMLSYLLPMIIGYTGGYSVYKQRGAVVGAIATIGVVVGADIPMFMGAMMAGPLGGICIKWFDDAMKNKIPAGFEMLVNNFSAGIIGAFLAIIGLLVINPVCLGITAVLNLGVQFFVDNRLLPLTAIFVEPAKVLFLNNAINHGIFSPLGIEQAASAGKSIFFMIESNPGPGMGLLLAYCLVGKGSAKSSAPGAAIIHFLGGIHEIYFPYVLMNPVVILAPMAGNMCAIFILQLLNGGLIAAASPGSIFAELMMTPRGGFFVNILAILIACAVSFILSLVLLKFFGKDEDLETAQQKVKSMKAQSKGLTIEDDAQRHVGAGLVNKIVFACDAGMGSSAMGATMLRKKLKAAGLNNIEVIHASVSEIPSDAQIIVTHHELKERAQSSNPSARLVTISNFMGAPEYDELVKELVKSQSVTV